jgi:hypothetical protein
VDGGLTRVCLPSVRYQLPVPAGNSMPDTQTRLTDVGDADAIAAHRPCDADAFARREPSRPAPMRADAVLVSGTGPGVPVTLPATGSLADWITRGRRDRAPAQDPARATSVTLPGPLFRLAPLA